MFTTMAPNDTFVSDGVPRMVCHRWMSIMRRSNYAPLAKNDPAKGVTSFREAYIWKT